MDLRRRLGFRARSGPAREPQEACIAQLRARGPRSWWVSGRLRVLSGAEVCQILEHGFAAVRQRGSHRIMQKRIEGTTITVPVPLTIPSGEGRYLALFDNRS